MLRREITAVKIKAKCGHEYSTLILYADERDLNQQISDLTRLDCVQCVKRHHGEIDSTGGQAKN